MTSRLENKFNEYRNSDKFLCESAVEYIVEHLAKNIYNGVNQLYTDNFRDDTFSHSGYSHRLYDIFQNKYRKELMQEMLSEEGIDVEYRNGIKICGIRIYDTDEIIFRQSKNNSHNTKMVNTLNLKIEECKESMEIVCQQATNYVIDMLARNLSIGLDEWETTSEINHMFDGAGECHCLYQRFTNEHERKIMEDLLYKEGIKVEYSERIEKCGWMTLKNVDVITFSRI